MKQKELIKQTITDALGYDVAEVKIEGSVADITTTDYEKFSVMLSSIRRSKGMSLAFHYQVMASRSVEPANVHTLLISTVARRVLLLPLMHQISKVEMSLEI